MIKSKKSLEYLGAIGLAIKETDDKFKDDLSLPKIVEK